MIVQAGTNVGVNHEVAVTYDDFDMEVSYICRSGLDGVDGYCDINTDALQFWSLSEAYHGDGFGK